VQDRGVKAESALQRCDQCHARECNELRRRRNRESDVKRPNFGGGTHLSFLHTDTHSGAVLSYTSQPRQFVRGEPANVVSLLDLKI